MTKIKGSAYPFIWKSKFLEILERDKVLENIWGKGEKFIKKLQAVIGKHDVRAELTGIAPIYNL